MVGAYSMLFQLISHTVNLLLHKINRRNFISQKFSDSAVILAISVSKRCNLDLSVVKAQGSIAGFLFFLPFCQYSQWKFFTDHIVPASVEFGIPFSIKFLSSSALLGFRKALEEAAMSSSVSRRKGQNTCEIWFSRIVIYRLILGVKTCQTHGWRKTRKQKSQETIKQ